MNGNNGNGNHAPKHIADNLLYDQRTDQERVNRIAELEKELNRERNIKNKLLKFVQNVSNTRYYTCMDFERVADDARELIKEINKE